MTPADDDRYDPAVHAFLDFLERDMKANPDQLRPITMASMERMFGVADGLVVDLDEEIEGDVGL